jgi:glycosyltransferase involved in cell wall biosynthesis
VTPTVTCVVTAYDDATYVRTAIDSALHQRGLRDGSLEVIAVDDGSTDGTRELLAGYGDAITVLDQDREGPTAALYRALEHAHGEYLALLDADDEWLPDKLARQLDVFARRPEVALVYGDMRVVDGDGRVLQPSNFAWTAQTPAVGRVLGTFLGRNLATTSTVVLRTDLARSLPQAPAWAWCRDWWLAAHVAVDHELDCVLEPVTNYRMHGANLSAISNGVDDKALRLWHRDLRLRRHFLRRLDLGAVALDDLRDAQARMAHFARRVAEGRGEPLTAVVPVDAADRDEARAARAQATDLLDADPVAAARLAARAWAADPFDSRAEELGRRAGDLAVVAGRRTARVSAVSRAQDARVRELRALRDELAAARGDEAAADVLDRLARLRRALATLVDAGEARGHLLPIGEDDRRRQLDRVAAADGAQPAAAAVLLAAALAIDPGDDHADLRLRDAVAALQGRPPRSPDLAGRKVAERQPLAALDGAKSFVGLAFADELVADPTLLAAWAQAFDGDDDATLAIYAPDGDAAAVEAALVAALTQAGLALDDDRDMAAIVAPATPDLEAAIARGVGAICSRSRGPRCFGGLPSADEPAALRALAAARWSYDGLGRPISVAIKICPQRWHHAERWGDLHFARAIADELERRGHRALIQVVEEWDDAEGRACDVALHLRGLFPYVPHPGQLNVLWTISHPELVTAAECDRYDLVFTASARHPEILGPHTATPIAVLEQATDPVVFFPEAADEHVQPLVFVGNSRGVHRPVVRDAMAAGLRPRIWGAGWAPFVDGALVAGEYVANHELRRVYSSAGAVLNDHWDDMRAQGFISNRVYDVLASGGVLISDDFPELRAGFGDALLTYSTADELRAHVERLNADPAARAALAGRGRELVLERHTFAHRVDTLLGAVARHGVTPVRQYARS